jgi:Uma2 family endonuclease
VPILQENGIQPTEMFADEQKGTPHMAVQHNHWISLEEYHQIERASEVKYEYSDGRIYDKFGGTFAHSRIAGNMYVALDTHLRGKVCKVANSDMKVLPLGNENPSYFPDVTVTCNPNDYRGDSTVIHSPHLIIEVLSPSTAAKDRGEKLQAYHSCSTVEEYVMISTHHQQVEVYHRESADKWTFTRYRHEQAVILASVGLTIPVSEIYVDTDVPPLASILSAD